MVHSHKCLTQQFISDVNSDYKAPLTSWRVCLELMCHIAVIDPGATPATPDISSLY